MLLLRWGWLASHARNKTKITGTPFYLHWFKSWNEPTTDENKEEKSLFSIMVLFQWIIVYFILWTLLSVLFCEICRSWKKLRVIKHCPRRDPATARGRDHPDVNRFSQNYSNDVTYWQHMQEQNFPLMSLKLIGVSKTLFKGRYRWIQPAVCAGEEKETAH